METATKPGSPARGMTRESVELRQRRLASARRRATLLLAGVTLVFIAVTAYGAHGTLLTFVQFGAEAAMVGGVADWFAVTAVFRHPLGIPIPHTAVLVARKDQFAATLGQFVQENFLNADVLSGRLRAVGISARLSAWLSTPANATRAAVHASSLVATLAEALRDEDAQRVISAELSRAVDAVDVSPLAGRVVRVIIAGGHHSELFNTILANADGYLDEHHEELRQRFESEAPRWVPGLVYGRVFDRMYAHLRGRLEGMANDPDDETRKQFEAWIDGLPDRLETDPAMRERGEQLKDDLLGSPLLRDWSSMLWGRAKEGLRTQAADPQSELHQRMTDAIEAAGHRLAQDPKLQERIERFVESSARGLADQFHDELAGLVTNTIERWDGEETSTQLELLLGRDLQFIRINGTVVGCAVGLALHAIALGLA
ncbi:MAG TPA: DUF445 domain-containing protein [Trebonia sp.]|jgi:uncharacterized membrane-anchored protein YjiN (DUF445 family)|nr:DUF445 domain-containing protein [Trebonia sp.]